MVLTAATLEAHNAALARACSSVIPGFCCIIPLEMLSNESANSMGNADAANAPALPASEAPPVSIAVAYCTANWGAFSAIEPADASRKFPVLPVGSACAACICSPVAGVMLSSQSSAASGPASATMRATAAGI